MARDGLSAIMRGLQTGLATGLASDEEDTFREAGLSVRHETDVNVVKFETRGDWTSMAMEVV
jgi:hypothetical protein